MRPTCSSSNVSWVTETTSLPVSAVFCLPVNATASAELATGQRPCLWSTRHCQADCMQYLTPSRAAGERSPLSSPSSAVHAGAGWRARSWAAVPSCSTCSEVPRAAGSRITLRATCMSGNQDAPQDGALRATCMSGNQDAPRLRTHGRHA